jgi:hypothetical protein
MTGYSHAVAASTTRAGQMCLPECPAQRRLRRLRAVHAHDNAVFRNRARFAGHDHSLTGLRGRTAASPACETAIGGVPAELSGYATCLHLAATSLAGGGPNVLS